jgi:membrane protein YqaA with SNARE-associated domain
LEALIDSFGYFGLFIVSLLSASILPLAASVALAGMVALGYNPVAIVLVATIGSTVGALINYFIGREGGDFIFSRFQKIDQSTLRRAEQFFEQRGAVTLGFSWLPFIGDALTVVAGAVHTDLRIFLLWVTLGRAVRESVTVALALQLFDLPHFERWLPWLRGFV